MVRNYFSYKLESFCNMGGLWQDLYWSLWPQGTLEEKPLSEGWEWWWRDRSLLFSIHCYKMQAKQAEGFGMKSEAWDHDPVGKSNRKCLQICKKTLTKGSSLQDSHVSFKGKEATSSECSVVDVTYLCSFKTVLQNGFGLARERLAFPSPLTTFNLIEQTSKHYI